MNKLDSSSTPNFTLVYLASVVILISGIMFAADIVIPLLLALFVSIICTQPILWLKTRKVPLGMAIAIIFTSIIALFLGLGELIAKSLSSFSNNVDVYEENLNSMGASILGFLESKGFMLSFDELSKISPPSKIMSITASVLGEFSSIMGNGLPIFFLALFLLLELESIPMKVKIITLESTSSIAYFNTIGKNIRQYLFIKTIVSLITGIFIWISMTIIGVDYAIIWALIAFLLNYIPNIGSIIAAIPAVLMALVQLGWEGVIWTTVVFVAVNVIIGNVVEPKMMGKGLGLSTFVIFVSLIFWGFVLGTVGMFLSVPLTMSIKIALEQNPSTKPFALLLGTQEDAVKALSKAQAKD